MTGAGSSDYVFAHEGSFKGSPTDTDTDSTPNYWEPGRDPEVGDLTLDRALERLRAPLEPEAVESIAQNIEGATEITAVVSSDVQDEVEQLVFNDGGAGFVPGRPNSARFYTEVDYLDGTAARELVGVIPLSYSLDWEQGGMVQYTLTLGYATEHTDVDISVTPSDVTRVADGTSVPFHGCTLQIDGAAVSKLQDFSLSIEGISRFQWGADPEAADAVIAAPETTLDVSAIISGRDKYELALGGTGATSTQDSMSSVAATIDVSVSGTTVSTYNLPKVKPNDYSWDNLIDAENDTQESYSLHVNGGVGVA